MQSTRPRGGCKKQEPIFDLSPSFRF